MQVSTALNNKFEFEGQLHSALTSALAREITHQIDLAHGLLMKSGYPTRAYTKSAVTTLLSFNQEKQLQVLENAKKLIGVLSNFEELEPEVETEFVNEVALAQKALGMFGLRVADNTWEDKAKDRIIEVYTGEGVQLYRSMNFFKTCGYSLLDLCVNEWYVLWERPSKVMEQLNTIVAQVMTGAERPSTEMPVRPHIVRETYDDGTTQPFLPRSIVVQFRDMFPAFNARGDISGFVVTSEARVLDVGDDALKLGFI